MAADIVLVTGAGGFIGSHVVDRLIDDGRRVRALVRYNAEGRAGWLDRLPPARRQRIELLSGDVRDADCARAAVAGVDTVLHLAALIDIAYSYRAPRSYLDTNVGGTLNLLQAARDAQVRRFVQTSTSEVYGTARTVPMAETHPLNAQSPYAASKTAGDQLALSFHAAFGLPVTVLRPFNAYGPRQSVRAVIPTIVTQALAGADRIRLGALHPTRDFNFAPDLAHAFVALAACDQAIGQIVNVGSGFEIAIADVLALVGELIGRPLSAATEAARLRPATSEVERLFADAGRMAALTGWRPDHGGLAGFRRGLEKTIAWYAAAGDGAPP
jgi:NAD dependent epimerase/dehydratase